jgi:hypothetical protein
MHAGEWLILKPDNSASLTCDGYHLGERFGEVQGSNQSRDQNERERASEAGVVLCLWMEVLRWDCFLLPMTRAGSPISPPRPPEASGLG